MNASFPFAAIVAQKRVKTAYLANLVNPGIGGLLISGPKGSGKSTIVHSVTSILPEYKVREGCLFRCDPADDKHPCEFCREHPDVPVVTARQKVITLPLSCTEDRLIGSIDVEKLLKEGKKEIQPGILGKAHRNILYIDEVNLLPDHLVDDILDAAASHWNSIEREGVSVSHPTDFVLVGTMNPEEGELRPQILDRFPLCVPTSTVTDPALRVEIIKRRLLFEKDPHELCSLFAPDENSLKQLILEARTLLERVTMSENLLLAVAEACVELKVDGQRPDVVIVKTAGTLAALDLRSEVQVEDVITAACMTLIHRTRDCGLLAPPEEQEIIEVFRRQIFSIKDSSGSGDDQIGTISGQFAPTKSPDSQVVTSDEQKSDRREDSDQEAEKDTADSMDPKKKS